MKPYFSEAGIEIYLGDCREILPQLPPCDLLLTDPPYGMKERTMRKTAGRGKTAVKKLKTQSFVDSRDWAPVYGDDERFDPSHLLPYPKVVLFGAIHFAEKLPPKKALDKPWKWFVWDKREGTGSDDNSDCDFAWSNLIGAARLYSQMWRGICRRGEENVACGAGLVHPTQKPVALMQWIIAQCRLSNGQLLVDPYVGSGSSLLAAKRGGLRAIGIEIEEKYCEISAKRLSQSVFNFPADAQIVGRDPKESLSCELFTEKEGLKER